MKSTNYKRELFILIAISTVVRSILAYFINLGGEESYCWSFALYPKLSQMESTPMVGWIIQLSTCNLAFNNELFVRFGAILCSALSTWMIYVLGRRVKNEMTGFYAAVLYTASIYCSLSVGTFISPASPQVLFLLLAIYFLHEGFIIKYNQGIESRTLSNLSLTMSGIFIGLATLSHISSILIWVGALIYILLFNKKTFGRPYLYLALIITLLMAVPVILWHNVQLYLNFETLYNHITTTPHPLQVLIQSNPINLLIILASLVTFKRVKFLQTEQFRLFISLSLPFLLTGNISIALLPLFMVAAASLEARHHDETFRYHVPRSLKYSIVLCIALIMAFLVQIYSGIFNIEFKRPADVKIGYNDISLDKYGFDQLSEEFRKLRTFDVAMGKMSSHSSLVSDNYMSAAQMEYYLAYPDNQIVKTIGSPSDIKRYILTTLGMDEFKIGESAYYIESSRGSRSGMELGMTYYKTVEIAGRIYIHRMGKPVIRYTIYRFKELQVIPSI